MVSDDGGCVLLGLFLRDYGGVRSEVKDAGNGDLVGVRGMKEQMMGPYV
jgi:hypothetical protein